MTDFTVYKCDHEGRVVWQYDGVVLERGTHFVCLQATFNGRESDAGFVTFRKGDVFTEWFYTDRWYNVFRIEDGQNRQLKGWYCNITRPAIIEPASVRADDLALDVFVQPDGTIILLDEDEFDALDLPAADYQQAQHAVEAIRQRVTRRTAPFQDIQRS